MERADLRQPVAVADVNGSGLVFADAVEGHDNGALEGRGKKRRGGVRAVMSGVLDRSTEAEMLSYLRIDRQLVVNEARDILYEHAGATAASRRLPGPTAGVVSVRAPHKTQSGRDR